MFRLTAAFALLLLVGCSNEENDLTTDQLIEVDLASDAYQNSNVGIYNGVFTSNDGQQRGSIVVTIPADEITKPSATLEFASGENVTIESNQTVTSQSKIVDLPFSLNGTALYFSVEGNGTTPKITNVILNNQEGSMLIKKHTTRAPVVPIPGTYICDDCGTHPVLNNTTTQTFNLLMFTAPDGDSSFETEVTLGMNVFDGTGSQNNCIADGTETTCDLSGSFMANGAPITWSGTHTFNNEAMGVNDCSGASGTWTFVSNNFGTLSGTFESDDSCEPTPVQLIFEDFEDATVDYVLTFVDTAMEFSDYFRRTDGTDTSEVITNVQGITFFGAQDTDGVTGNGVAPASLTWNNIPVAGLSTINFSAFFAEGDDGANQDWDSSDFVNVEYSTDGGNTFTTFFSIRNDGSQFNSAPQIDTDLDGIGDGAEITNIMEEYLSSFTVPAGAVTMSIRINTSLNSGDEDIAIDNVTISGI